MTATSLPAEVVCKTSPPNATGAYLAGRRRRLGRLQLQLLKAVDRSDRENWSTYSTCVRLSRSPGSWLRRRRRFVTLIWLQSFQLRARCPLLV